jgi:hypothetical protein
LLQFFDLLNRIVNKIQEYFLYKTKRYYLNNTAKECLIANVFSLYPNKDFKENFAGRELKETEISNSQSSINAA